MSLTVLAVAGLVLVIGAIVQGSIGFGAGLLAAPILALVEPSLVPGPLLIAMLGLLLPSLISEWRGIQLGELGWSLIGRLPGSGIGALAVAALPTRWLAGLISMGILGGIGLSWRSRPASSTPDEERSVRILPLFAVGVISGFMGTTASAGGPPMAMLYVNHGAARLRAALSSFFTVGVLSSVAMLAVFGQLTPVQALRGVLLTPFVLAGWGLSWLVRDRVADGNRLRIAVMAVSAVAAVVLLIQALLG